MTRPSLRPDTPRSDFARIRRKLAAGAALYRPFRFARLFWDGEALARSGDLNLMFRRTTEAIASEKALLDADDWKADENRLWGLHECRIAIRRMRAAKAQRREAA